VAAPWVYFNLRQQLSRCVMIIFVERYMILKEDVHIVEQDMSMMIWSAQSVTLRLKNLQMLRYLLIRIIN